MTFATWKAFVLTFLDVDAARRGIEPLRDNFTKSALADLKHYVPCFKDNKSSYADTDEMPFGEDMEETAAEAVAMYIKTRLVRLTEKDLNLAGSFDRDYVTLRRRLVRECQDRTQIQPVLVQLVPTRGDTFEFEVPITLSGVALNPTGHEVRFTVKADDCDADTAAVMNLSTAVTVLEPVAAITISDAVGGKVMVLMNQDHTALLQPGKVYRFDVELIQSTGETYTILSGTIRAKQDTTNLGT